MAATQPHLRLAEPVEPVGAPPTDIDALYRDYSRYVATIAYRLLGREHEVDDVVQDVFLVAIKSIGQVREAAAVKGWLATITVHTASKKLRLRKVRQWLSLDESGESEELVAPQASPEQQAVLASAYVVLDRLPVDERVPWVLRHIEGERLDRVAQICGYSLATAKRRIEAAQVKLDRMLA